MAQSNLTLIQINFIPANDTIITPPDTGDVGCVDSLGAWVYPSYYSTGEGTGYLTVPKWNAFNVVDSCLIGCFALWVCGYSGDRTDDSVRFWLYNDTLVGGIHHPGHPIATASNWHYDWTEFGSDVNHYFPVDSIYTNHSEDGYLSTDDIYWIGSWAEPMASQELCVVRGGSTFPNCASMKAGPSHVWPFNYMPDITDWDIHYGGGGATESCVGNSIWGELIP